MLAFRLALVLALSTFGLLLVGGAVNPTGSSLACPDWPLCYGEVFPEMTGGVLYEHSHRLVATFVGLLTIAFVVAAWRRRPVDRGLRALSLVMLIAVILQGVLGGITVIYRLPTLVSTAHLGLSLIFFTATCLAVFRSRPGAPRLFARLETASRAHSARRVRPARIALGVAVVATWVQALLGGLVRHVGAGRACGTEWPLCGGELWPLLGAAQLHQAHRFAGYLVAVVVIAAALAAVASFHRLPPGSRRRLARLAASVAPVLVLLQVVLGILTVLSNVGTWQVVLHLGGAAALLATLFVAWRAAGEAVLLGDADETPRAPHSRARVAAPAGRTLRGTA